MAARCSDEDKKYNETFFDSINCAAKQVRRKTSKMRKTPR